MENSSEVPPSQRRSRSLKSLQLGFRDRVGMFEVVSNLFDLLRPLIGVSTYHFSNSQEAAARTSLADLTFSSHSQEAVGGQRLDFRGLHRKPPSISGKYPVVQAMPMQSAQSHTTNESAPGQALGIIGPPHRAHGDLRFLARGAHRQQVPRGAHLR